VLIGKESPLLDNKHDGSDVFTFLVSEIVLIDQESERDP
jgi:hypothetical protein